MAREKASKKGMQDPLKFLKILTIIAVIFALVLIFLLWKFNVVDFQAFKEYKGKSRAHLLGYCDIEKFRCKTTKLENDSIILNIKNNFNEYVSIKEVSFGTCANNYDILLKMEDKAQILLFCEDYKDMKVVYQRSGGIVHESEGRVFYFLDMTSIFKLFYKD